MLSRIGILHIGNSADIVTWITNEVKAELCNIQSTDQIENLLTLFDDIRPNFLLLEADEFNNLTPILQQLANHPQRANVYVTILAHPSQAIFLKTFADALLFTPVSETEFCAQFYLMRQQVHRNTIQLQEKLKYEQLRNQLQEELWMWEIAGNELHINPAFYRQTGYALNEFPATLAEFCRRVHPDDLPKINELLETCKNGQVAPSQINYRFRNKNAQWQWLGMRNIHLKNDENGNPLIFSCSHLDIDEQMHSQEKLQSTTAFYKALIEKNIDGIVMINHEGRFMFTSPTAKKIFGYTDAESSEFLADQLTHPDDLPAVLHRLQQILENKITSFTMSYRFRHKNGNWIWIESTFTSFLNEPAVNGIVINFRDITEKKIAERELQESTRKLNTTIDNLKGVVYRCKNDPQWTMEYISGGILELSGYPSDDFINNKKRSYNDIVHPDDRERLWKEVQVAQNKNVVFAYEYRIITADKLIRWVWERGRGIYENDKLIALEGFITDISENKLAEQHLRASEERWRSYLENAPYGVFILDRVGNFLQVNPEMTSISGYSAKELQAMHVKNLVKDKKAIQQVARIPKAIQSEKVSFELQFQHKNKTLRWCSIDGIKLDENRFLGFTLDITERKQSEFDLAFKNAKLAQLNQFSIELSQFSSEKDINQYIVQKIKELSGAKLATLSPYNPINQTITTKFIESDSKMLQKVNKLLGKSLQQISAPVDEHMYNRMMSEGITECRSLTDVSFGVIPESISRVVQQTLKIEYFIGIAYIIDGELFGTSVMAMRKGQIAPPVEILRTFGYMAALALRRKRIEEENKLLEEQLRHSQKMESIGRLAGGVAHDFNNMLQAILGYTELGIDSINNTDYVYANLLEIQKAAQRSAELTRQLLGFARRQTVMPKTLDLNDTIAGMLNMLRRLIGEEVDLVWQPGDNLWMINIDPIQINQILANLCVNAKDAMKAHGELVIETQNISLDAKYTSQFIECLPGDYVVLSVSDNGEGMDKQTQEQIFEPFFTTKTLGEGTGLGLATVYGIVKQNNGYIHVYSEPNIGTTFRIYLPRHSNNKRPVFPNSVTVSIRTGKETILVVEDELAILNMTKAMLEHLGYKVLTAATPVQAMQVSNAHAGKIDLLLTDVVMPEMNGREMAKLILPNQPNMKRLFMSGYTANVIAHHGVINEGVHYIQKPFSMQELADKIKQVMENIG